MEEHKAWSDPASDPIGDMRQMVERSKAAAEGAEPPPEIVADGNPRFVQVQHGRGFGKTARAQAAPGMFRVRRPIRETARTRPGVRPFARATAGHTVWRDVPSWHQVREPSSEAALWNATKRPPWVRKRKVRAKAKLQKASRVANRG